MFNLKHIVYVSFYNDFHYESQEQSILKTKHFKHGELLERKQQIS